MSASAVAPPAIYPEFKNILFAPDFSQRSAFALNCLRLTAWRYSPGVRVVHVVPPDENESR